MLLRGAATGQIECHLTGALGSQNDGGGESVSLRMKPVKVSLSDSRNLVSGNAEISKTMDRGSSNSVTAPRIRMVSKLVKWVTLYTSDDRFTCHVSD